MATAPNQGTRKYLYIYDLPKKDITSVKLAEIFKAHGIQVSSQKPQIHRDLFKPFYTAIVPLEENYEKAKEEMRYFDVNGCPVRSLPFDNSLRGDNKAKIQEQNVFYKFPKDQNLTYDQLHQKFSQFGPIKSIKISLNGDHTQKGFAFICFENRDDARKCTEVLGKTENVKNFEIKEGREVGRKLSNNLYFKNIPTEMTEPQIKALFDPYGKIKLMKLVQNDMGQFGFVCYEDPNNKNHGPEAVSKAVEALNNKTMGEKDGKEIKLYVKEFLNKDARAQEKFQEMIRYKNSKKRCNLYVKNFPPTWSEEELKNLFQQYGEIERVKLEKGPGKNTYAFVCFKKPDACSQAKQNLQGQTIDGKGLIINHYEIKEIRDLQLEEIQDKRDWEKYISQQGGGALAWSQLSNQPNLTHIIQQLLSLMQQQPQQMDMRGNQQRGRMPNNQRRMNPRPNQQQNQMNQPQMMRQIPPQPGMMQQPPMVNPQQQQQQPPQQQMPQQPMNPAQAFVMKAQQLLPSVQERNPYLKESVGHLIYEYVEMIVGNQKAPKITGMLIELPVPQIKQYLGSFEALQHRVMEADQLLTGNVKAAEAQK